MQTNKRVSQLQHNDMFSRGTPAYPGAYEVPPLSLASSELVSSESEDTPAAAPLFVMTAPSAPSRAPKIQLHSKRAIDLQKMNWKLRAGFLEHTGVSLKEHLPNNPRGAYTRVHQDTAQSRHRQRPPQPSAACLSAR